MAWVVLLVAVLAALNRLGHGLLASPPLGGLAQLGSWAGARGPTTVAFAVVRLIAVGLSWYLLGTIILGAVARLVGLAGTARAVERVTLPGIRRLLGALATVSLSTAAWAGPVAASPAASAPAAGTPAASAPAAGTPAAPAGPRAGCAVGGVGGQEAPAPAAQRAAGTVGHGRPAPPTQGAGGTRSCMATGPGRSSLPVMRMESPVEQMAPAVAPWPARYVASTWTVRPGDNLWSMAATTLSRAWGRAPTDAEVDRYWTVLIGANRERLAHPGLPDLIFAGQVFTLPPTPAPSEAGA